MSVSLLNPKCLSPSSLRREHQCSLGLPPQSQMPDPFERLSDCRSHSPRDPAMPDYVDPPAFQDELAPADSFQIPSPSFSQSRPPFQYRSKPRRSWCPTEPVRLPCHPEVL